jgi:hypothetical protein
MNRNPGSDTYAQAGQWLIGTAKRNPEALLVLAAGCALLMRGAASAPSPTSSAGGYDRDYDSTAEHAARAAANWSEGASRAVEGASQYASDIKDRVTDVAGSYAASVSEYAGSVGRTISTQTSRLAEQTQSTVGTGIAYILREQPLAVVALGVAAGAALAAILPTTEVEDRTLGAAREAIADAADKVGENLREAAGEAGERLKQGAAERGMSSEGLKGLAHEVADTFTNKVTGTGTGTSTSDAPGTAKTPGLVR